MRIVVDLDGVICPIKKVGEEYADLAPLPGAVAKLRNLRAAGHYIIIHTARHMRTCEGNVGLVMRKLGKVTLDWLEHHQIEYDEVFFGKPNGHVYLDDRAFRFQSWDEVTEKSLAEAARER